MPRFPAGTVAWAQDPTNSHDQRPVIVLAHENHPFGSTDCTVMCAGTQADKHDHRSPQLESKHISGISFSDSTYLMPWALYTVPPGVIHSGKTGRLTEQGERLVKKELIALLS